MSGLAEGLAVISAGLKAIELWEKYGPVSGGTQTLDLTFDPAEFAPLAATIETNIADEYRDLFKSTGERVRECIRLLKLAQAAGDDLYLPDQRRKFGRAARMCVCREIGIIEEFLAGDIPEELNDLWKKHKCVEARAPMAAG
jgi:hypothetical protein